MTVRCTLECKLQICKDTVEQVTIWKVSGNSVHKLESLSSCYRVYCIISSVSSKSRKHVCGSGWDQKIGSVQFET
jgi:hypothetical protein